MFALRRTEDGSRSVDDPPLLHLSLHSDIYDPDSSGGDNEAAAAANGSRLTSFLHRIEQLGATFEDVETAYSPGATRYGYGCPSPPDTGTLGA